MRFLTRLAARSAALAIVPAVALAVPIQMTPNPLGAWTLGAVAADVSLQSGDTQPTPTVVLRARTDGSLLAPLTVNFDFGFDVEIVAATATAQSGVINIGPIVTPLGDPRMARLAFVCGQQANPCSVDVTFELASPPATLDVTDSNNQFSDSPGAPNQTLSATFSSSPVAVPALGPLAFVALAVAFLLTGSRRRR